MSYPIIELEVTEAIPTLRTADRDTGVALILRYKGKPIGFCMKPLPAKSVLTPKDLAPLLSRTIGTKLLREKIREELVRPASRVQYPSLAVAICTKDRPENLSRCLQHLLKLRKAEDSLHFEILVVDNSPSDERAKELAALLPGVRYLREPKVGLNFARNRAVQEANGDILAYLDDDVIVDRCWLDGLMEAYSENPDAAAFTGLVLPYEMVTEAQIIFEKRGGFRRGFEKIRYGRILPDNPLYPCGAGIFGAGCNMAFRREVLVELGGFDEALDTGAPLPGGGDLDIFYRIIRSGYFIVYEPQYLVFHEHRRQWGKLRRQYWSWGLGFSAFVVKSYQQDVSQRSKLFRLMGWWFQDQLNQLGKSLICCHPLPPIMILAELCGGIVGLLGEYPRSVRRVEKVRKQFD